MTTKLNTRRRKSAPKNKKPSRYSAFIKETLAGRGRWAALSIVKTNTITSRAIGAAQMPRNTSGFETTPQTLKPYCAKENVFASTACYSSSKRRRKNRKNRKKPIRWRPYDANFRWIHRSTEESRVLDESSHAKKSTIHELDGIERRQTLLPNSPSLPSRKKRHTAETNPFKVGFMAEGMADFSVCEGNQQVATKEECFLPIKVEDYSFSIKEECS